MRSTILSLVMLFVVLAPITGEATVITLNPTKDTTLNESTPNNNMGAHADVHAGTTFGGADRRAVLAFDIAASVPAGATINSVTLQLVVPSGNVANPSTFAVHRLLLDFNEGNKVGNNGAPASAGECTWITSGVAAWSAPGAQSGVDYMASASATSAVAGLGSYPFVSAQLVADVQSMLDTGALDFGWILISQSEGTPGTARRFAAKEDSARQPALVIDYTDVPVELMSFDVE